MGERIEFGSWTHKAMQVIEGVHATLPADISFADRKKAIDGHYPFGERKYFPYKCWLRARRIYLNKYDPDIAKKQKMKLLELMQRKELLHP